jgi:hypothetical protein
LGALSTGFRFAAKGSVITGMECAGTGIRGCGISRYGRGCKC